LKIDFYDFYIGVLHSVYSVIIKPLWGFEAITKGKSLVIAWFTDSIVMSVLETVKDIFNEIDSLFFQLIQDVMTKCQLIYIICMSNCYIKI
jgi:hypothetical protein